MHPLDRTFRWVLPGGALAVLVTAVATGWLSQPDRFVRDYAPRQPIPFSHALHAGQLQITCVYCHSGAPRSRTAGIPSAEVCMGCHEHTATDRPAIRRLAAIHRSGTPLFWQRVHTLPDHVYFDHRPHVNAGIACQSCHGAVEAMPVVVRRMAMRMSNCLACHRDPHGAVPAGDPVRPDPAGAPAPRRGPEHCAACHR
jgi:hypothetical protein